MQADLSLRTSQREESYFGSSSHTLEDEEDFIDDNSSTSTAGPPPDSPQSTGRFNRPWNLATAQQLCSSEGSSPTSSLNTRNTNNRTGSFRPFGNQMSHNSGSGSHHHRHQQQHHSQASTSSNLNTGTYPIRTAHGRTFSGTNASVSPPGSSTPQEFSRSFRLFNTSRYLPAIGSGSRQRDWGGGGQSSTLRSTMVRNMDNGSSGRPSGGGDALRDSGGFRNEGNPYLAVGVPHIHHHQRQSSLFNTSYGGPNMNGSICFHNQPSELRSTSMVFASASVAPLGFPNTSFLGAAVSPLLIGVPPSQRGGAFGAAALELACYAVGGGQLVSSTVTPTQRVLPTLLGTLRSHLALNGRTIIVGNASHPLEIKRGNLIGTGGFAKVFVGVNTCRGELVAIKEIQVVDVDDVAALREIEQEFGLLRSLRHPNIVSYHLFEHSRSQKLCRIVMEFLAGDSTLHLLQKFGPLTETILRRITRHLLDAITYIHREGIFHRDIKPANILVSHKGEVKLCDFGCSKRISELNKASSCIIGTPVYMAPELIKGEATHKADIWSMGCSLFELATGLLPWYHSGVKDNLPLMFYITTTSDSPLVLPSAGDASALEFSTEFMQFMESCFVRDPNRRPEAAELLKHPWISGVRGSTPSTSSPAMAAAMAMGQGSAGWSPRFPTNFLSLRAESQDSVGAVRRSATSPVKGSEPVSPRDSAVALSNEDSFVSELAAARLSTSTAVLAASPLAHDDDVVETELHCQQELEEVSASTAIDLCHALMNFPENAVKSLEQRLVSVDGDTARITGPITGTATGTGTGTSESSPTITRTFSAPSHSLASHRGPISTSLGDFPSPSASPEHSILHDNFYYNQAQLGASAGNFVLPSEFAELPAQQYLRINEDGNLDFATVHEYDSDVLGDTVHGKSTSADSSAVASFSSRMISPGHNSSFSRASGSQGLPFTGVGERRVSPQRSALNSGYFSPPRGESPFKATAGGAAGGMGNLMASPASFSSGQGAGRTSPVPPLHLSPQQQLQSPPIPPPPLLGGARPSPTAHPQGTSPRQQTTSSTSSRGGDEALSSQTQSPSSIHTPQSVSFRQLPEKAKVAADGKLHMSFSVSTIPGHELSVPLDVDVSDVHCKMVDNQPSYFVAFSDDIKGQITSRIKEVAAQSQSVSNSPAHSFSSRTTSPRGGVQPSAGSTSGTADSGTAAGAHQRAPSSTSGVHFYNSPSYRASRSPARTLSRLSSNSASHSHHAQQPQRPTTFKQQEHALPQHDSSPMPTAMLAPSAAIAGGTGLREAMGGNPASAEFLGGSRLSDRAAGTHGHYVPTITAPSTNPPIVGILSTTNGTSPRPQQTLSDSRVISANPSKKRSEK